GGMRHIIGDGALRRADELGVAATFTRFAVAKLALLLIDGLALSSRAAARRQPDAIGPNGDVPESKIGFFHRLAEARGFGGRTRCEHERGGDKEGATHRHVSPRPCCRRPSW